MKDTSRAGRRFARRHESEGAACIVFIKLIDDTLIDDLPIIVHFHDLDGSVLGITHPAE